MSTIRRLIDNLQARIDFSGAELIEAIRVSFPAGIALLPSELEVTKSIVAQILCRAPGLPRCHKLELVERILEVHDLRTLEQVLSSWYQRERDQLIDPRVSAVLALIESNLANRPSLRLAVLARGVHLDPTYLSKLIARSTGTNLTNHIRRRRVLMAVDIHRRKGEPLGHIALQVGYKHATALSRDFRRVLGTSPRRYLAISHPPESLGKSGVTSDQNCRDYEDIRE